MKKIKTFIRNILTFDFKTYIIQKQINKRRKTNARNIKWIK